MDPIPAQDTAEELFEDAPCGYVVAAPDGTLLRVNRTFLSWTGHERGALEGTRRFQDLLAVGGRIYYETHLAPLLRMQDTVEEIALEMLCADGGRLPVLVNASLRRGPDGTPLAIRAVVVRTADRQAYERELRLARGRERAARERTERLQSVTAELAAAPDADAVAQAVVGALAGALAADGVTFVALDAERRRLRVLASHGEDPAGSGVTVPLEIEGRSLGEIRILASARLTEEDSSFAMACARQAAQALERIRLHEATAEDARRTSLLAETGRALDEAQGVQERAERLVEILVPAVAAYAQVELPAARERAATIAWRGDEDLAGASTHWSVPLPVRARGRVLGTLLLVRRRTAERFRAGDLPFLGDLADRAGLALENALLYEREHRVALKFQESLLAARPPEDPRVAVATHYQPATATLEVGGDWYDTVAMRPGEVGVGVGDVVGRGLEAAATMGQLRSAVRALAAAEPSPSALLHRLDVFVEHVDGARMATLAFAVVDLETGRTRYACAGHPPPVLLQPGAEPEFLWGGRSAPLGAAEWGPGRTDAEVVLQPGARLLLYTDGVIERRERSIDDGLAELLQAVAERRDAPLGVLVRELPEAVQGRGREDDVCLLCVSFGAGPEFRRGVIALDHLAGLRADLRVWLAAHGVDREARDAIVLACSEAVANAIEHGHRDAAAPVRVEAALDAGTLILRVRDRGTWRARRPGGNRGRGLRLIERLMDDVAVEHGDGTSITMRRAIGHGSGVA